jgi:predicted nucleotidyltransferase
MNTLSAYKKEINALCTNHKVKSLYAFGWVLTPNFNTDSDVDLIVDFKFYLQEILNRPVDLFEQQAIKNPYFKEALNKKKVIVYKEV